MIVISSSLVLAQTDGLDNPSFLWRSIVSLSNLAAGYENSSYPATNLVNPATHLFWRSTSAVLQYLTVTTNGADTIDAVGIAAHNFGTAGIAVSIEGNQGSGWSELVAPVIPADDDAPLIFRFTAASYSGIRVKLAAGSAIPQAAVLYVGEMLVSPQRIAAPYTPITMGRVVAGFDGISVSGEYLGSVITGEHRTGTIPIQYIDADWYRENMDEFIAQAARRNPFFFAWQPTSHPTEVGYVRASDDPNVSIHHNDELFSIALNVIGTV